MRKIRFAVMICLILAAAITAGAPAEGAGAKPDAAPDKKAVPRDEELKEMEKKDEGKKPTLEPGAFGRLAGVLKRRDYRVSWTTGQGRRFLALPQKAAVLCGFEITSRETEKSAVITSIRPVFLTARGRQKGKRYGQAAGNIYTVFGKKGYAVRRVSVNQGPRVKGLRVEFARLTSRAGLNGSDTYESDWYGQKPDSPDAAISLGWNAYPAIGIHGHCGETLNSLGLIAAPPPETKDDAGAGAPPAQRLRSRALSFIQTFQKGNRRLSVHEFKGNYYAELPPMGSLCWGVWAEICRALGGHLVTISSPAENQFVRQRVMTRRAAWMGLTDYKSEGDWKWVTGEPLRWAGWSAGEPNNAGGEHVAEICQYRGWNDVPAYSKRAAICEWEDASDPSRSPSLSFYARFSLHFESLSRAGRERFMNRTWGTRAAGEGWIKKTKETEDRKEVHVALYGWGRGQTRVILHLPKKTAPRLQTGMKIGFTGLIQDVNFRGTKNGHVILVLKKAGVRRGSTARSMPQG